MAGCSGTKPLRGERAAAFKLHEWETEGKTDKLSELITHTNNAIHDQKKSTCIHTGIITVYFSTRTMRLNACRRGAFVYLVPEVQYDIYGLRSVHRICM